VKAVLDRKPWQPGDVPLTSADVSHSKEVLGYEPHTPIREGLKKFADWIKGEGRDFT
jgi:UDP-glucuronate 4-epimerase